FGAKIASTILNSPELFEEWWDAASRLIASLANNLFYLIQETRLVDSVQPHQRDAPSPQRRFGSQRHARHLGPHCVSDRHVFLHGPTRVPSQVVDRQVSRLPLGQRPHLDGGVKPP